jgi:hypothetical protein
MRSHRLPSAPRKVDLRDRLTAAADVQQKLCAFAVAVETRLAAHRDRLFSQSDSTQAPDSAHLREDPRPPLSLGTADSTIQLMVSYCSRSLPRRNGDSGALRSMKATLVVAAITTTILSVPPAFAGAATGTPSPFFPPYPDFGGRAHCPAHVSGLAAARCRQSNDARPNRQQRAGELGPARD